MLYNFTRDNEQRGFPADIHFLIPQELITKLDAPEQLDDAFSGLATIHVAPDLDDMPFELAQLLGRAAPWTVEWQYAKSYSYYMGLLAAELKNGAPFDYIEFPDFGGWAVASLEAKRADLAFGSAQIVARLHSTQGALYYFERYAHTPSSFIGVLFDTERFLLSHADLIVGHVPSIVEFNRKLYDFDENWIAKSVVEFPPIVLDNNMITSGGDTVEADDRVDDVQVENFIFSSRLQQFKRPDIFVRAAITFCEKHPKYEGVFRVVSYGWDDAYIESLTSLVPGQLKDRIIFHFKSTERERAQYIRESVVVVPSDYESLCIFAFEASEMGRKVILNGTCPAFGRSDRWEDRENCLLFNGSVSDLVRAMEESVTWQPKTKPSVEASKPYWLTGTKGQSETQVAKQREYGLTIVCYGFESKLEFEHFFNIATHLEFTLRPELNEEIVFAMPKGLFAPRGDEVRRIKERGWKVVFTSGLRECPAEFGKRIYSTSKEYVLFCASGYDVNPGFIKAARRRLSRDNDIVVFSGHVQLMDSATAANGYLRVYAGEMPTQALITSRIFPPPSLIRREVLKRIPFDPLAGEHWFQIFSRQCALAAEKIVVAPIFAASLDDTYAGKRETTKRLSGGILDRVGLAHGIPGRLLALEQPSLPDSNADKPYVLAGDLFRSAHRINPYGKVREWEPVIFSAESKGLLVHPLEDEIVAAELRGPSKKVARYVATVNNVNHDNTGVDVSVLVAPNGISTEKLINDLLQPGERRTAGYAKTEWVYVASGEKATISLGSYAVSEGHDRILLLTRIPDQGDETNCHLIFERIEAWYNENLI
jgi:glycosyltransferase involved in cell wall biosynthesis